MSPRLSRRRARRPPTRATYPEGSLTHGRPHERDEAILELVVAPAGAGKFAGRLDGRDLCVSTKPLLDAARVLLAEGVDPEMVMQMHHLRSATLSLRSTVGAAAGLTVLEGAPFRRGHRREVRRFLIVTTRASRVAVDRRRRTVRVRQGWACVGFDTLPEADYTDDSACTKPQQSQHGSNPYSRRGCCPVVRKHVVVPSQGARSCVGFRAPHYALPWSLEI